MLGQAAAGIAASIRRELRDRLAELGQSQDPAPAGPATVEAEEALRRLMVRHRPRLDRRDDTLDQDDLTACIQAVVENTGWRDLRFIDGLNLLYESWPADFATQARNGFIVGYRQSLHRMLAS